MVIGMFENQAPIRKRLSWAGLSASSFYYKPQNGRPGRTPSETTLKTDGSVATNQQVCMDIKYIYIEGQNKYAYLLSLIDVYTRRIMGYVFKPSIKQHDVLWLLRHVIGENREVAITICNDNGSQFIATSVREYLKEIKVNHEFTHIARHLKKMPTSRRFTVFWNGN